MPCFHPLPAWRTESREITLRKEPIAATADLKLPCGGCIGCRTDKARAWALRCHLELQQHQSAAFTTLTYDERHLPPTLEPEHLSLWLKRLRKAATTTTPARPIRFFASGEYGETTGRPHYHAILFGLNGRDQALIERTWRNGHTNTVDANPATIAYVAGYSAKKIGWKQQTSSERVDPDTGEVYTWRPPFIQMSRRPGIGGHARQWPESWRLYAVHNGTIQAVPRYLHEAWKHQATPEEIDQLLYEKSQLTLRRDINELRLEAEEKIAIARQANRARRRKY